MLGLAIKSLPQTPHVIGPAAPPRRGPRSQPTAAHTRRRDSPRLTAASTAATIP